MDWVQGCAQEHRLTVDPTLFRMNGVQLCQLTQQQFCQLAQVKQCGDMLYSCLEKLRGGINKSKVLLLLISVIINCRTDSMLGMEFRPTYEEAMLPGGLMVDNMIDGLPSFPPTFDEHNGMMFGS